MVLLNKSIAVLVGGFFGAFTTMTLAYAQTAPEQQTTPVSVLESAPLVRNADESVAAYLVRAGNQSPYGVSEKVVELYKSSPAALGDLIAITLADDTNETLASEVLKGIAAVAASDAVSLAREISSLALADPANVGKVIAVAREANSIPLAEVSGEGLALAANMLREQDNAALSAAIQTQATSRDAPVALSEVFLDNILLTAADRAAQAAAAAGGGGGDVTGNVNGSLFSGSTGDAATTSTATQTASTQRSITITSTSYFTQTTSTSPISQ